MENNNISSFQDETSTFDISHSAKTPLTTQEILITSSYLQSINTTPIISSLPTGINRYTYTTPIVSPVARFNAIDHSLTQFRSFDSMSSENRFIFMPTPSLPSSPINIRSTNISNLVDIGINNHPTRNQVPSSTFFPSNNFCIHCEICHNCPIRRFSYLNQISPNPSFTPRFQPSYMHHQPLNSTINVNRNFVGSLENHVNLTLNSSRSYLNGMAHTKQMFTQMYKCSICHIEFPTAQAYGGHMSSHSKARKAHFRVDEAWARPKRTRLIHQNALSPNQQQSSFSTRMNNANNYLEEFDKPQEVKKEKREEEEKEDTVEEDEDELKYLIADDEMEELSKSDLE